MAGDSITITSDFGFTALAILCVSDTIIVNGVGAVANGIESIPIVLSAGQGIVVGNAEGSTMLLNNILIDASGGQVSLVGQ